MDESKLQAMFEKVLKDNWGTPPGGDAECPGGYRRIVAGLTAAFKPVLDEVKSVAAAQQKADDERKAASATADAEKAATALTDAAIAQERGRAQTFTDAAPFLADADKTRLASSPAKEVLVAALADKFPGAAAQDEAVLAGFLKGLIAAKVATGADAGTGTTGTGAAVGPAAGAASGGIFGDANSPTAKARARFIRDTVGASRTGYKPEKE